MNIVKMAPGINVSNSFMDTQLYLFVHTSVHLSIFLFVCVLVACPLDCLSAASWFNCLSIFRQLHACHLSICLFVRPYALPSVRPSILPCVCLSLYLSVYLSVYLFFYLHVCLSVCLSTWGLSVCLYF